MNAAIGREMSMVVGVGPPAAALDALKFPNSRKQALDAQYLNLGPGSSQRSAK